MNELLLAPTVTECQSEWMTLPVSALATHISGIYHERMRDELPLLTRKATELSYSFTDGRVFDLRALAALLTELRGAVDGHAWTEDDLLFPAVIAHENPVLITTLSPDRMLRLVYQLAEDHVQIRRLLARVTAYIDTVSERASEVPQWADLITRIGRLRDYKLEELDLEDRCVLPRARALAEAEKGRWSYR